MRLNNETIHRAEHRFLRWPIITVLIAILLLTNLITSWGFERDVLSDSDSRPLFYQNLAFIIAGIMSCFLFSWLSQFLLRFRLWCLIMGLIYLVTPLLPVAALGGGLYIRGARRFFILNGLPWRTAIHTGPWAVVLILPFFSSGITEWVNRKYDNGSDKVLVIPSWLLVNCLLLLQRDLPMIFLLNGIMFLLVIHTFWRSSKERMRWILLAIPLFIVVLPVILFFCKQPERLKHYLRIYDYKPHQYSHGHHTRAILENIKKGGAFGHGPRFRDSQSPSRFDEFHVVDGLNCIKNFVLQAIGYQFGWVGVTIVLTVSISLLTLLMKEIFSIQYSPNRTLALALWLFLTLQMLICTLRTLNLVPFVPSVPFPFLSYGKESAFLALSITGVIYGLKCVARIQKPNESANRGKNWRW